MRNPIRLAVLVLVVGLIAPGLVAVPGALAAPKPNPNYTIDRFVAGERLLLPLLMSRYRHSEMTRDDTDPDRRIGYGRNLADAHWQTQDNGHVIDWFITAPSVSPFKGNSKVALIDIFQFDQSTGLWRLVDVSGKQLLDAAGKPVQWDTSSQPSLAWDLSLEADLQDELSAGKLHSEPNIRHALVRKLNPALGRTDLQDLVDEVGSEKMFCSGPSDCVNQLKRSMFPKLQRGVILTDLPSESMLKRIAYPSGPAKKKVTEEAKQQARDQLRDKQYSDVVIEKTVQDWDKQGRKVAAGTQVSMGGNGFGSGSGNPAAQGPAVLGGAAAGTDPGGIDFTSLQLRYLSEDPGGSLRYAYSASPAGPGAPQDVATGQLAMAQMSDAFYVWLSLPTSTFWVNLNPNEPDRILEPRLATTDVGRILLQADLAMKKISARLTNPNTDLGRQFWGEPDPDALQECVTTRQWIVPKPASVYQADGGIYIVDAPLEVKAESELSKGPLGTAACAAPSARMERVFEQLILPKVEEAVNTAPEFAELRRVYLARVAAEWYRERRTGALTSMINSGDVRRWPALQPWSPKQVFDDYVKSYRDHEYDVTRTVDKGNYRYTFTYSDGGVDFADVPFSALPKTEFQQQHADMSKAVGESFQHRAPDAHNRIWLGATAKVRPQPLNYATGEDEHGDDGPPPGYALSPGVSWTNIGAWALCAVLVLAVILAFVVLILNVRAAQRRRLRAAITFPYGPMPPGGYRR
ncbi:hypothetical protein ACFO1B_14360 [Dactylosporangium siamense]|uniref:Uncharacterized protein n=1 Tax=Dactylosporangium siamense TaxID=685454 RepID=A0A919PHL9_9ACTN|nr:hypothetical protein [Dactylosporangium siamense]GIG45015.1 hypothetical protein Dsi01nite_030560 [Dactylosporangium siamense]